MAKRKAKAKHPPLKGYKKASNKTTKFTYYYNPKTRHVFKDTDRDGRKG